MLINLMLPTLSKAQGLLVWAGEAAGLPLTQIGNTIHSTVSGYSLLKSTATTSNEEDTFTTALGKHVISSTITTALLSTVIGSVVTGSVAMASPVVLGTAAATSAGLFLLENTLGEQAGGYARAYMQYKTAGVALEASTRAVDYGISLMREDWDKNYFTDYKNIALSLDSLQGSLYGKSYLAGYMSQANDYLNSKIYDLAKSSSWINGLFDAYVAYKVLGFSGLLETEQKNPLNQAIKEFDKTGLKHVEVQEKGLLDVTIEEYNKSNTFHDVVIENTAVQGNIGDFTFQGIAGKLSDFAHYMLESTKQLDWSSTAQAVLSNPEVCKGMACLAFAAIGGTDALNEISGGADVLPMLGY